MFLAQIAGRRGARSAAALLIAGCLVVPSILQADHSLLVSTRIESTLADDDIRTEGSVDLLEEILQPTPEIDAVVSPTPIAADEPTSGHRYSPVTRVTDDGEATDSILVPIPAVPDAPVRKTISAGASSPASAQVKVFLLAEADAFEMAGIVKSLVDGRPLRVAADRRTNSLVVVGDGEEIRIVQAIVSQLDGTPSRSPKTTPTAAARARTEWGTAVPTEASNDAITAEKLGPAVRRHEQAIKELKTLVDKMAQPAAHVPPAKPQAYDAPKPQPGPIE
jgi:hypothetical protein